MMSMKRLRIEKVNLEKEPVPLALASPLEDNVLEWRFLIKGTPGTEYEGGYYHGKLLFPPQYPMKPPGIMFCTPSGRFETGKRVCLTISDFHPETWSPLWTVGSILTGIVSFMNSDELTTGGLMASAAERRTMAAASKAYNLKDKVYCDLFGAGDPEELFAAADAKLVDAMKKRQEKAAASAAAAAATAKAPPDAAVKVAAGSSVDAEEGGEGEHGSTALTKSAKKRLKEKEKAARRAQEEGGEGKEEVVAAVEGAMNDLKLPG
jgi:ubiquitin-protein ligase